jgi:hypothetical protein
MIYCEVNRIVNGQVIFTQIMAENVIGRRPRKPGSQNRRRVKTNQSEREIPLSLSDSK